VNIDEREWPAATNHFPFPSLDLWFVIAPAPLSQ
jgi:hypothetical protein